MKRMGVLLLVFAGIVLGSCKKNSDSSSVLQVQLQAANKSFSVLKSATVVPALTWDVCTMNVSHIEFKAERKEDANSQGSYKVSYEWKGTKLVDLFNASSVIGDIKLDPGIYEEIQLEIDAAKSQNSATPVFYLSGSYTNQAGVKVPIEITMNEDFKFEVEQEGISLDGTNDYSALVNLNLTTLMSGISQTDLDSATLTNGKIIITSTSNSNLYMKMKSKISSCEDVDYKHHGDNHGNHDD